MNKEKLKLWLKENSFDKNGKIFTQKIKDKGKIDEIINGYKFKVVKLPKRFLPLTVYNLKEFLEYYKLDKVS